MPPSLSVSAVIFIVHACETGLPPLVTEIVKLYVPGVVAMPMSPALAPAGKNEGTSVRKASPVGKEPLVIVQEYVPLPPEAVKASWISPMGQVPRFGPTVIVCARVSVEKNSGKVHTKVRIRVRWVVIEDLTQV